MSTPPKHPKTVNRLQRLITEWERESGQPGAAPEPQGGLNDTGRRTATRGRR
jgi:hypothetical protein